MFLLGATGLLLTWKAELGFTPHSQRSKSNQENLISLQEIQNKALFYADSLNVDNTINRIDYRPSKGIAKVRFEHHFTEIQIDCYSGKLLSNKQRTADIIEMIHDGSILDFLFKNTTEGVKLFYSTLASLALILLSISGFWLWFKPRQIKKYKSKSP